MIYRIITIIVIYLILSGAQTDADHLTGRSAYLLRFDKDGKQYLVKLNVDQDKAIGEILLPQNNAYNDFALTEIGDCYISDYRYPERYGRNIYYYDSNAKQIKHFMGLNEIFGPRYMAVTKDKLVVEVKGNDRTKHESGILFINRKRKKIKSEIFLNRKENTQANIDDIFFDGKRFLYFTTLNHYPSEDFRDMNGNIYTVDVENEKIVNIINIPDEYKFNDGIVFANNKIYVAPGGVYDPTNVANSKVGANYDLLVFSLSSGKIQKKVKISAHPYKLAYDPSVGKIYVQHMSDSYNNGDIVEIIDVNTDKIIGKLNIPSQLMMSLVKPGKMYITVGDMFLSPTKTEPGLLVLDTRTDKIIKRINGNYQGISVNNFIY